ncbi:glycoside hydrolase family 5 protein [Suillus subalutaceus]|uniref:glycoside hydrolase family 5 protein n=1 Tax=Suillus subalutaceus TaxID=48586 RepID=UPI001B866155|nr:glycoside hydrolase family 5 protein [Suillus subalutaceus]KAG1837622.1 glycoside hydrolase family 5 protein [Suillus subalutaceus]
MPESGTWFQLVQNGTTTINDGPTGLQKLDTVVIMSLTNNWNPVPDASTTSDLEQINVFTGGMDLYVCQFGLQDHDDFYTDGNILTAFQNYTKQIVLRYLNSPAVFSWELANDAICNSTLTTSPTCTTQTVTKWHALMAEFIASIDANHIVSVGTSGFQCTDCPKLYPIAPTASPTLTPSPCTWQEAQQSHPFDKEQIIRQRAESRRQNRAAAKRAGTLKEDGSMIRGRWVSTDVSNSIGPTTDGSYGVDSQDILNIPNIGFGSFQVFPDQNSLVWIQQSAQSAAVVGKPLVLNGFGLVSQSNLNDYVPFNMTCAPYASSKAVMNVTTAIMDATTATDFASDTQQQQGYSSFMQMGNSAGLAGYGSTGITSSGTATELDKTNSSTPATGNSPNDGYSIANNTAIIQILTQGAQAMAEDP